MDKHKHHDLSNKLDEEIAWLLSQEEPPEPRTSMSLQHLLINRYHLTGDEYNLEAAISHGENALVLLENGSKELAITLLNLAILYNTLYHHTNQEHHLDKFNHYDGLYCTISEIPSSRLSDSVFPLPGEGNHETLGVAVPESSITPKLRSLNRIIFCSLGQSGITHTNDQDYHYRILDKNLSMNPRSQPIGDSRDIDFGIKLYETRQNPEDINSAVDLNKTQVDHLTGHSQQALMDRASHLLTILRCNGGTQSAKAFKAIKELQNIKDKLLGIFSQKLRPEDVDMARSILESYAVEAEICKDALDPDGAERFISEAYSSEKTPEKQQQILFAHSKVLVKRYLETASKPYLDSAINIQSQSLSLLTREAPTAAIHRYHLGALLFTRYLDFRDSQDFSAAIGIFKSLVESVSEGNPIRSLSLNVLRRLYNAGNFYLEDDEAFEKEAEAVKVTVRESFFNKRFCPEALSGVARLFGNWAASGAGYRLVGGYETQRFFLDFAILCYEESLRLTPEIDIRSQWVAKIELGSALKDRLTLLYRRWGGFPADDLDLERAIKYLREANASEINSTFPVLGAHGRLVLGELLNIRYYRNRDKKDLEEMVEVFLETARSPAIGAFHRMQAARLVVNLPAFWNEPSKAIAIIHEAIETLPMIVTRSLPRSDQQRNISMISRVACMAAAAGLESGIDAEEALGFLERGRGVIASLIMESRTDTSMLEPAVAIKYSEARKKLEDAIGELKGESQDPTRVHPSQHIYVSQSQARLDAERAFQKLIKEIQADPKTKGFLKPPTLEGVIGQLGEDTIVVLNYTPFRSDAFILNRQQGLSVVKLERLTYVDFGTAIAQLNRSRPYIDSRLLEWIWDAIACPILEKLNFTQYQPNLMDEQCRIIWIPTGPFIKLPIHAAGRHARGSTETVMDRVISSYSSSLRSYCYAKQARSAITNAQSDKIEFPKNSPKNALLVGMSKTLGFPDLKFVDREIGKLESLCPKLGINPWIPFVRTCEEIKKNLKDSCIIHFAGHGYSDPLDPSQSGIRLEDGLLTVESIQKLRLEKEMPFLAYLSACSTNTNDVGSLADEGISIVNAFQLIGFRHVIGTLWQVDDSTSAIIAEGVYDLLRDSKGQITDRSVCTAVHAAIVRRRDQWLYEKEKFENSKEQQIQKGPDDTSVYDEFSKEYTPGGSEDNIDLAAIEDFLGDEFGVLSCGVRFGKRSAFFPRADLNISDSVSQNLVKDNFRTTRTLVKAEWVPYVHYGP
ncbi:hypothetical protein ABW19_dt0206620 [Dactylella cylindrospora]|nr:hypothetical protein ABW19_dt0206620 [Dactylella cylindrospora]